MDELLLKQSNCVFCKEIIYTDSVSIRCKKCYAEWHPSCGDVGECLLCTDNDVKAIRAFVKTELSWWIDHDNIGDGISIMSMALGVIGLLVFIAMVTVSYFDSRSRDDVLLLQAMIVTVTVSLIITIPGIVYWMVKFYRHLVYLQRLKRVLSYQ